LNRFAGDDVADGFGRPAAVLTVYQNHGEAAVRPFYHFQGVATLTGGVFAYFGDGEL
jgi:hypothetical protein